MSVLSLDFFEQNTVTAAEQLLGCYFVRRIEGEKIVVRITETEAYRGEDDPASHAHRGVTPRNRLMFGRAGRLYVYFSYGMHHCMNVVTEQENIPGAVLIRAGQAVQGRELIRRNRGGLPERQWLNGPGKLTQAMNIDMKLNGYDLLQGTTAELCILAREKPVAFKQTGRVGISKAQDYPWRFVLTE